MAAKAKARGKRKLDFSLQPLQGKVFFLDLPRVKSEGLAALESTITQRGGTVEKLFHKKVRYLVTTRHKDEKKSTTEKPTAQSPLFTLSPDTPEGGATEGGVASNSPLEGTEGTKSKATQVHGRGASILAKSKQKGKKAVDVLKMASEWGVKLLTLEELMAELKKHKPPPMQNKDEDERKQHYRVPSVRELKSPFIKVEDQSGDYRPLIFETDKWPLPNYDCPPHASPYDTIRKNGKVTAQLSRATGARLTQDLVASLPGPSGAACTARRKPGYCECCAMRYEDLKMHLQSKKHRDYATNGANFATLDAYVTANNLDLDSFINSLKREKNNRERCTVKLITPPPSPPTSPHESPTPCYGVDAHAEGVSYLPPLGNCTITAGFASPKRGLLCLSPVAVFGMGSPRKKNPALSSPLPAATVLATKQEPSSPKMTVGTGSPRLRSQGAASPKMTVGTGSPRLRSQGASPMTVGTGSPRLWNQGAKIAVGTGSPRLRNLGASSPKVAVSPRIRSLVAISPKMAAGTGSPRKRVRVSSPGPVKATGTGSPKKQARVFPTGTWSPRKQVRVSSPVKQTGTGSPRKQTLVSSPSKATGTGSPRKQARVIKHIGTVSPRKVFPIKPTSTGLGSPRKRVRVSSPVKATGTGSPRKQALVFPIKPTSTGLGSPRKDDSESPQELARTPRKQPPVVPSPATPHGIRRGRRRHHFSPVTSLLPAVKRLRSRSPDKARRRLLEEVVPETPEKEATCSHPQPTLRNLRTLTNRLDGVVVDSSPVSRRRAPVGWACKNLLGEVTKCSPVKSPLAGGSPGYSLARRSPRFFHQPSPSMQGACQPRPSLPYTPFIVSLPISQSRATPTVLFPRAEGTVHGGCTDPGGTLVVDSLLCQQVELINKRLSPANGQSDD